MQSTDIETAAEGLLFDATPAAQDDDATAQEAEVEELEAVEGVANDEVSEDEVEGADDADETEADDADEETEESEGDEQPQVFTVKVNGEETEVTLEDLTRSYSGQSYIQKGMQEAAEMRKQSEAMYANLQAEQQKFVETVQQLQQSGLKPAPQKPDAKMLETDPIGYMQANAAYEAQMSDYTAQQRQIAEVQQRNSAMQKQAHQVHLQQQLQELQARIPEFSDPEKAQPLKEKLLKTGVSEYGFSAEEMGAITDARAVSVLVDAMKWRDLQSGTAAAKKKPTPPKTVKPTGRRKQAPNVARNQMRQQAKKSGKLEDFAALLLEPRNG